VWAKPELEMLGSHFDRVRQAFADQFEPDAQGFVYRKYMKAAPIQVSVVERDRYINAFNRFTKYSAWGIGGGTVILGLSLAFYATTAGIDLPETVLYYGLGAIFVAFMAGYYWSWNLPARELRGRGTSGEARSRAEIRQRFLEKLTYGQIAASACAGAFLLLKINGTGNMLSGWHILWTGLAAALFTACAIQAFRKWRFGSQL
jgi:hypothetical protein